MVRLRVDDQYSTGGSLFTVAASKAVEDDRADRPYDCRVAEITGVAASRVFITPDYHGHNSFNFSGLLCRGIAQGISAAYYPSQSRTAGALAEKFGYAIGRDALTAVFREFWPDIATHLLHRHP